MSNKTGQALWIAIGSLSKTGFALASAVILSRFFDKIDYGVYKQVLFVYTSLVVLFTAGLPKVFSYYLPRVDKAKGKTIVFRITFLLFILGIFFSAALFFFSDIISTLLRSPLLASNLRVFSMVPLMLLPTLGIEGIFVSYQKSIYAAFYHILTRTLTLLCVILPVIFMSGGLRGAMIGWVFGSGISLIIAMIFKAVPFKGVKRDLRTYSIIDILKYSSPLVLAKVAGIAIVTSDQFFISRYFGPEIFADFSNGFTQLPFLGMITGTAATVLMPYFSGITHDMDEFKKRQLVSTWRTVLIKSAIIIYPLTIFCMIYAENIIVLLYSKSYIEAVIYFRIALILNFFNIILFTPLLLALGETRFYARMHLIFVFFSWIGGYLIATRLQWAAGIAAFSVMMALFRVFIAFFYSAKILKVHLLEMIPVNKISVIFFHSGIIFIGIYFLANVSMDHISGMPFLVLSVLSFAILLYTSRFVGLDYMLALRPLFLKFKRPRNL